ncbi:MAG: hypothetical protein R3Y28_08480 [Candidatus Gastranaerophilales bacterium]
MRIQNIQYSNNNNNSLKCNDKKNYQPNFGYDVYNEDDYLRAQFREQAAQDGYHDHKPILQRLNDWLFPYIEKPPKEPITNSHHKLRRFPVLPTVEDMIKAHNAEIARRDEFAAKAVKEALAKAGKIL